MKAVTPPSWRLFDILPNYDHVVIPVIFTTAQIYVTDANISSADLVSGRLPKGAVKAKPADWIWYNYNRSTQLTHDLNMTENAGMGLGNYFHEFTRTIAIVGPEGVESFFRYNFNQMCY